MCFFFKFSSLHFDCTGISILHKRRRSKSPSVGRMTYTGRLNRLPDVIRARGERQKLPQRHCPFLTKSSLSRCILNQKWLENQSSLGDQSGVAPFAMRSWKFDLHDDNKGTGLLVWGAMPPFGRMCLLAANKSLFPGNDVRWRVRLATCTPRIRKGPPTESYNGEWIRICSCVLTRLQ